MTTASGSPRPTEVISGTAGSAADAAAEPAAVQPDSRHPAGAARATPVLLFPVAVAAFVLTFLSVDITAPALPAVRDALRLSGTAAGMVVSLYFVGRLVMSLPAGLLVERLGARWTMALGAAVLAAGSAVCAVATGAPVLLTGRVIQGMALALLLASTMVSIVRARPGDGAAVTVMNVGAGAGSAMGLLVSGALVGAFDWPGVFLGSCVVGMGMLTLAVIFPATAGQRPPAGAPTGHVEVNQAPVPLGKLATPIALNLLIQAAYSVFMVVVPLYAAWKFDATPGRIGTLLLTNMVTQIIMAVIAGRLIRRYRAPAIIPFGLVVAAVGLLGIMVVPRDLLLVPFLACWAGGMVTANMSAADVLLDRAGRGTRAVTLSRLATDIAQVVGPAAVGLLLDLLGYATPIALLAAALVGGAVVAARDALRRRAGLEVA